MSTFSNVLQDNRKAVNKSIGGHADASKIALDSSRERTNGIIGQMHDFALVCFDPSNAAEYVAELTNHGIIQDPDANPFFYPIALLVGIWKTDKDGVRTFNYKSQKGWTNRATVLRALSELKVKKGEAANYIKNFVLGDVAAKFPKLDLKGRKNSKLDGLRLLDKLVQSPAPPATVEVKDSFALAKADSLPVIDLSERYNVGEAKYVMLWAMVDAGLITPRGLVPDGERKAKALAILAGQRLMSRPSPEAIEEIQNLKRGAFQFSTDIGSMRLPEPDEVRLTACVVDTEHTEGTEGSE